MSQESNTSQPDWGAVTDAPADGDNSVLKVTVYQKVGIVQVDLPHGSKEAKNIRIEVQANVYQHLFDKGELHPDFLDAVKRYNDTEPKVRRTACFPTVASCPLQCVCATADIISRRAGRR